MSKREKIEERANAGVAPVTSDGVAPEGDGIEHAPEEPAEPESEIAAMRRFFGEQLTHALGRIRELERAVFGKARD